MNSASTNNNDKKIDKKNRRSFLPRWLGRWIIQASFVLIFFLVVLWGISYWLVAWLPSQHQQLADLISDRVGVPVSLISLHSYIKDTKVGVRITELQLQAPRFDSLKKMQKTSNFLNPSCQSLAASTTQLEIQKKKNCILRIGKLNAEFDWLKSIWQLRPVYTIDLNDVEVDLNALSQRERTQDIWQSFRTWWDHALALPWQDHVIALLGAQDRIRLHQARLFGNNAREQNMEWIISDAYTQWRGNFHDIKAKVLMRTFEQKRAVEMPMTVTAQLNGHPETQNEISAVLQVKAKAIPLQSFLPPMQVTSNTKNLPSKLSAELPSSIHAAGFWLEIKNGSLHRLAASWKELDTLNTPMRWVLQRQNTWDWLFQVYWQENLKNKSLPVKDHRISGRYTRLTLPSKKQQGYLSVLINNWDVDQLRKGSFLQQWLSSRMSWLDTWQLKGKIRQARILIPVEENLSAWRPQFDSLSWRMQVQNVAFAHNDLAVSNVNIIALGNANRGMARVDQAGGVLSIPIFRSPLQTVNTQGKVYWEAVQDNFKKGWALEAYDLNIQQPAGHTTGSIHFSTQSMYRDWADQWASVEKNSEETLNTTPTSNQENSASANVNLLKKPDLENLIADLQFGKLSLNLNIENADGSQTSLFLPKQLPKNLLKWLDQSIKAGTLDSGRLVMEGLLPLQNRALNNLLKESAAERSKWNQLRQQWRPLMNTQFNFNVKNGELLFDPKWPLLTQANGAIAIHRNIVNVDVTQAQLGELPLGITHIHVAPTELKIKDATVKNSTVSRPPIQIDIEAYTQGEIPALISFLQKMPVQSISDSLWKALIFNGQYDAEAKIKFQIAKKQKNSLPAFKPQVDVNLALSKAEVKVPIASLDIKNVYGKLSFSMTQGLKAQHLSGQWLGEAVSADIIPTTTGDANAAGTIRLQGQQRFTALPWIKQPWMKYAKGKTNFTADLSWLNPKKINSSTINQDPLSLRVQTDWQGVAFNWPEPLQKSESEPWPFELRFIPGNRTANNTWSARWTNNDGTPLGAANFNQAKNALAGVVRFGSRNVGAPPPNRIRVEGKLKSLDVLAWQSWLAQQNTKQTSTSKIKSSKVETLCKYMHSVDVQLDVLKIWNQTVNQFDFTAQCPSTDVEFAGSIQHPELSAHWSLSNTADSSKLLDLSVSHIVLSAWADRWKTYQGTTQTPQYQNSLSQSSTAFWKSAGNTWPNIHVKTDQIMWRETNWGQWEFDVTPDALWKVSNIKASTHAMNITGNLEWSPEKNQSHAVAQSGFKNARDVMQAWGYPPTVLSKKGAMDMDMSWSGAPWQIKIAQLNGNLNMKIENGQLLAVDNAASVKALGLLNLSTLQKRLKLDFRDVYLKGLPFETLAGNFKLQDGWLHNNKFNLEGSSASFKAVGKVNLKTKEISQQITASLPLSDNLILPAAVVGGLPAAATAFVINKALGDQLDKLTTLRFRVVGEWSDPQVESVRLFD